MCRWLFGLLLLVGCAAETGGRTDGVDEEGSVGDWVGAEGERTPNPVGRASSELTGTVGSAARGGTCSTNAVRGLSQQLVDEIQCLAPEALSSISGVSGVTLGDAVFPYLQTPAAAGFREAAAASSADIHVSSGLRTLPQQYLLYQWYRRGRCRIRVAARPGRSNHESGLALDVSNRGSIRDAMRAGSFRWFGSDDAVHYDFTGGGGVDIEGLSVQAFQRLWNRNHPEDPIAEDGVYGGDTASRLDRAPASGFPRGADCSAPAPHDSMTPPPPLPRPADPCREVGTCSDCAGAEGCGWCAAAGACTSPARCTGDRVEAAATCEPEPPLDPEGTETDPPEGRSGDDPPPMCVPESDACAEDAACCDSEAGEEGICVVGYCAHQTATCGRIGAGCDYSGEADCCGMLACRAPAEGAPTRCCARTDDPCTSDDDCCGATRCAAGGRCECQGAGGACVGGGDCCGALLCDDGVCV